MIREDRELLAELARLNGDMAPLALRVMEGSASPAEQRHYAQRLSGAKHMAAAVLDEWTVQLLATVLMLLWQHHVNKRGVLGSDPGLVRRELDATDVSPHCKRRCCRVHDAHHRCAGSAGCFRTLSGKGR